MKNIKTLAILLLSVIFLGGCYSETINNFEYITIQLPINVQMVNYGDSKETVTPDNLHNYPEYRDNIDRIESLQVYQVGYHCDNVVPEESIDAKFKSMEFFVETGGNRYKIARFEDVSVKDMYRIPHIDQVDDETAKEISDHLLADPAFNSVAILDPYANQYFDRIISTMVIVVKIKIRV